MKVNSYSENTRRLQVISGFLKIGNLFEVSEYANGVRVM